ncbi:MAG TPA: bifunctional YncE family protein/alkaline phosphatase family protein [Bryobacteraceae bacterium]|nr:bifunctional YncE family protein/alkaline phosphatase family protein [Bryobacteraceae bacterium]
MILRLMRVCCLLPLCGMELCLAAADPIALPDGLSMTPLAAPHSILLPLNPGLADLPQFTLSQAVTTALSPDGRLLLVLTSGYNRTSRSRRNGSNEYVFVYDVTGPKPAQLEALPVPNSFCGLAWNPSGQEFYVSGGPDDKVYVFAKGGKGFERAAAIALGHPAALGLLSNAPPPFNAAAPKPIAAGIAVNQTGSLAVVANIYNDSISIIDLHERKKVGELDLRPDPAAHVAGGEFPYWVAIHRDDKAYVSSPRDREIVVVRLDAAPRVISRIRVAGQPERMLLDRAQDKLFAALDNSDSVAVIDTAREKQIASFGVLAPPEMLPAGPTPKGANPNSLALSPDERTLYVTDGGTNAVAVVALRPDGSGQVTGLIPTAWYPNSVSVSADGKSLFVVNSKSVPGPNPTNCRGDVKAPAAKGGALPDCARGNGSDYVLTLEKASLWMAPVPPPAELAALTRLVARNNNFERVARPAAGALFEQLRGKIKHVIYIVKENRTYDQVLGDLEVGNGDPALTEFPEPVTPNHHSFARRFVTLDNFYDSGEVSGLGWPWSVGARATDYTEKTVPINYANRGFAYDWEGLNRKVNVGYASLAERVKAQPLLSPGPGIPADSNLLPGDADVAAPDGPKGEAGSGYIWDEALRAGLTVRNYGFYIDLGRYDTPDKNPSYIPISKTPFADKLVQAYATTKSLVSRTDPYFRGFDQNNADFYNFQEWEREFDQFAANGRLPSLSLVRFCHDHFGSFGTARYGLNTPAMQMADNDYAIGLLAQKIAHSRYKDDTLIFVIEDDAQDGPDHVDAHRSVAFVVGPYVKQGAVISERYSTVSMIRTMEAVLGLAPSSLYSAAAGPMTEVFDLRQTAWDYNAIVPELLRASQLPLPKATAENSLSPGTHMLASAIDRHNGAWWQKKLGDMDYDEEDKLDTPRFNRGLWKGIMGRKPYPVERSGKDLRQNRETLLSQYWMK